MPIRRFICKFLTRIMRDKIKTYLMTAQFTYLVCNMQPCNAPTNAWALHYLDRKWLTRILLAYAGILRLMNGVLGKYSTDRIKNCMQFE